MNSRYDYVVLGSGIMSMLHALKAARAGKSVAILEREKVIGGAWRIFELPGFGVTELGPHVLRFHKEAYEFVEKNLCEMHVVDPEPLWLLNRPVLGLDRIPFKYVWVRELIVLRDGLLPSARAGLSTEIYDKINKLDNRRRLSWGEAFPRIIKLFLSILYERYRLKPVIKYFKSGTRALISKFESEFGKVGVDIYYECNVEGLNLDGLNLSVKTDRGCFECNNVYMTTGVALDYVDTNDGRYRSEKKSLKYHQIFISIPVEKPLTYIEVIDHPHIRRVFDITNYSDFRYRLDGRKKRLITATITDSDASPDALCDQLIRFLVRKKVLREKRDYTLVGNNIYDVNYYTSPLIEDLLSADPRCKIERTTDMSYSLKHYASHLEQQS